MALQCNYPVGNDISTQFLPAPSSLRPVHVDAGALKRLVLDRQRARDEEVLRLDGETEAAMRRERL